MPPKRAAPKYFGGAGAFAWDKSGSFVVVVGHAWLPKATIEHRADLAESFEITTGVYLNLAETEDLIDYLSVRVGGGQLDLSNRYLAGLLIPSPVKLEAAIIQEVGALARDNLTDPRAQELLRAGLRI